MSDGAVGAAKDATQTAREAAHSRWAEGLFRWGYATRGVVYLLIGWLAMLAALGSARGRTTDAQGAILTLNQQPQGRVLVALVAVGLLGYALWKLYTVAFDPERRGTDARGLFSRAGDAFGAVSYLALATVGAQLLLGQGNGGSGSDQQAQDWTARLLALPFGRALVVGVGLAVLAAAAGQLAEARSNGLTRRLDLSSLQQHARTWVVRFGRAGYAARGVVFGLVGAFFVLAAVRRDPEQATGLSGALDWLAQQPYGPLLLGCVALGLLTFGLFSLAQSRYGRLPGTPG